MSKIRGERERERKRGRERNRNLFQETVVDVADSRQWKVTTVIYNKLPEKGGDNSRRFVSIFMDSLILIFLFFYFLLFFCC